MLSKQEIMREFEDAHAILNGHFILSSGLHSATYLQCARVFIDAKRGERLCKSLAEQVQSYMREHNLKVDCIVAPAMGGVVVGYELARQLGLPGMFCERVNGVFELRRGFTIESGSHVMIVEDVVTTGKSSMEAVRCIEALGGKAVLAASLIDRRGKNDVELKLPLVSLLALDVATYKEEALPPVLAGIPAIKPGSRALKA